REPEDHAEEHAARVAASIRALAAIVGQLVAYRVERAVLDAAQAEIAEAGTEAERDALARSLASPFPGWGGARHAARGPGRGALRRRGRTGDPVLRRAREGDLPPRRGGRVAPGGAPVTARAVG